MCCNKNRPSCSSCGRRGKWHKRSCSTRNPAHPSNITAARFQPQEIGTTERRVIQDGLPAYEDIAGRNEKGAVIGDSQGRLGGPNDGDGKDDMERALVEAYWAGRRDGEGDM